MSCLSKSLVWFGGIGASLILAYGSLYLFYNYQHDINNDDDKNRGFRFLWPKSSTTVSENGTDCDDLSYEIITSDSDSSIDIIIMHKQVPTTIFEPKICFEKIQQKTCTLIEAKPSSNVCPRYQDISIQGYTKNVIQASKIIDNLIESTPLVESKRFEISAQMLPLITGIKGSTLKALCSKSGAEIQINPDKNDNPNLSTTAILDIIGTKEQIKQAYNLINELLNQEQQLKNNSRYKIKYSDNNSEQHASDLFIDCPESSNRSIVSLTNEQLIYMTETLDCFDTEFQQQKNPTATIQTPIPIYVSHVIDPTNFYVQVIGDKRSTRLDALQNEMKEFYDQEENRKSCHCCDRLSSNDLVAILATDGQYYRGYVIENGDLRASESESEASDSKIRVFFADLGMTCWHAKQNLFYLNANFLNKLPFQAINCCLYEFSDNIFNPYYQWTKEMIDDFRELTHEGLWEPVISIRNHGRVNDDPLSYPSKRVKFSIEMFRKLPNDPAMMTINVGKQLLFKK